MAALTQGATTKPSADLDDFDAYCNQILRLESVHKIVLGAQSNNAATLSATTAKKSKSKKKAVKMRGPYLCSLRVLTPQQDPFSAEVSLTAQTLTSSLLSNSLEVVQRFNERQKHHHHHQQQQQPQQEQHAAQSAISNRMPLHLEILSSLSGGGGGGADPNETSRSTQPPNRGIFSLVNSPRLLLTWTNVKDEFYECELTYQELTNHRKQVALEEVNWEMYITYLFQGLHSHSEDTTSEFLEDNEETQDILTLTILSPVNDAVKLRFSYELVAIRDPSDFVQKLTSLVFDLATYCDNLFKKREQEDRPLITTLTQQLKEAQDKLHDSMERLNYYNPAGELFADGDEGGLIAKADKGKGAKRKAPMSLTDPSRKRRVAKGAKIGDGASEDDEE